MAMTILHQGPGYTIAQEDVVHTAVPYGPVGHEDGDLNHGFVDLRDRPDWAASVPEAQRHPGFVALLVAVNEPGSCLMSIGCECSLFEVTPATEGGFTCYVGSYIDVIFRDPARGASAGGLVDLARALVRGVPVSREHHCCFEMIVQPLGAFFDVEGGHAPQLKSLGYGSSSDEAWAAFDHATFALAAAIRGLNQGAPRGAP